MSDVIQKCSVSTELAHRIIDAAERKAAEIGVPSALIWASAARIAAVAVNSVLIGKITILNPRRRSCSWLTGGVLPPSA